MDRFYWFALGVFAVWRVTHLLTAEDGPGRVFATIRRAARGRAWSAIVDCFMCASVWIAAPVALAIGSSAIERVLLWLALSGAACLAERVTSRTAAVYWEEEQDNGLLRRHPDGSDSTRDAA